MKGKIWQVILRIIIFFVVLVFPSAFLVAGETHLKIEQTIFVREEFGQIQQRLKINLPESFPSQFLVRVRMEDKTIEQFLQVPQLVQEIYFFVPACEKEICPAEITLWDETKNLLAQKEIELTPVRQWKIFLVPFTHIDIGFTQSQRKVLKQNLENLRTELGLIEQTRNFPKKSRFKLFTEVSWAVDEFLKSDEVSEGEKEKLKKALQGRDIELGAFYISHQNKFMPDEAIFASLAFALKISEQLNIPLQTACIHDVFDFSSLVKPLFSAGVKYLMVGPNDTRYVVPPLFYLMPPKGREKILVWHSAHLNGYGENFDLKMRLLPPFDESTFSVMEEQVNQHLKSLEAGFPNQTLSEYFDFYGAHWKYPYDAYLLPFYPAVGGDNQPQNIAPSELARKWNEKWLWPEMIVSVPSEFFRYVEDNFSEQIPEIRGEMSGFWGEQIFLSMMQVDPEKEKKQRAFERETTNVGIWLADKFLKGESAVNLQELIGRGYQCLILNNDHNPMPVPFGETKYTTQDVKEWKQTRREWIEEMSRLGRILLERSSFLEKKSTEKRFNLSKPAQAFPKGDDIVLENQFYRILIDQQTGGIKSLFDKELDKELVKENSEYHLNQYLQAVRGEVSGIRGYLKASPGYELVKVSIVQSGSEEASVRITGKLRRQLNGAELLSRLVEGAFGIKVSARVLNTLASLVFFQNKKALQLAQEIILPADKKRIEFVQIFSGNKPQWIEHIFAYPLNFSSTTPIEYDAGYNLLRFTPSFPLDTGDIIPSAKNIKSFPSINASLFPFQWMYGMPPDFTFRNYLLLRGNDYAVAFSSRESGAVIPGTLQQDPIKGPFGGGFFHLGLGWTLWGKLGLGAELEDQFMIHSALTSFSAEDARTARAKALQFSWEFQGRITPERIKLNPSSVMLVNSWFEDDSVLILRLWESAGRAGEVGLKLETDRKLKRVFKARSDGKALSGLNFQNNSLSLNIDAGEVVTLRLEFE